MMESMAMNAMTALDEVERRILQLADDAVPNHVVKLLSLQAEIEVIKKQLLTFNANNDKECFSLLEQEYLNLCSKHNLDPSEAFKAIYIESHLEKTKYVRELEGCLSGDPNLIADEASKHHWRHTAIVYAEKLEKRIKELETKVK
jgi:hypothetical protein